MRRKRAAYNYRLRQSNSFLSIVERSGNHKSILPDALLRILIFLKTKIITFMRMANKIKNYHQKYDKMLCLSHPTKNELNDSSSL